MRKKTGKVVVLLHDHNHQARKRGKQPLEDFLEELKGWRGYAFEKLSNY